MKAFIKQFAPPWVKKYLKGSLYNFRLLSGNSIYRTGIGGLLQLPNSSRIYKKNSFAQQGEDLVLDRILLRVLKKNLFDPGIYVDIGAYHPIKHSLTYLLYLRGWTGIAIDASSKTASKFKKTRPKDHFFQVVVGNEDDIDVDFFVHKGSNDDLSLINTKYPDNPNNYNRITHKQRSINSILFESGITNIDVLNIDIEGAELELLESFDFEEFRPKIICVEIHGNDIVKCLDTEVAQLLFQKGYKCVGCCVITFFFVLK